jgi:hypothetical protein
LELHTISVIALGGLSALEILVANALEAALSAQRSESASASGSAIDPAVLGARDWLAGHSKLNTMVLNWQRLEHNLADKARILEIDFSAACESDWPEARAMRVLNRKIQTTQRKLARQLTDVRALPALSIDGAVAKVELSLHVQGAFDWQENARELLEDGIAELRALARGR